MHLVAVIGSGDADDALVALARKVGAAVARSGRGLVCGGLGGVMEAACEGYRAAAGPDDGLVVGILPGDDPADANPWVDVAIPTGMGIVRNALVVRAATAVVAVGGESGTLSEIALAWQMGKPLCALSTSGGWAQRLAGAAVDSRPREPVAAAADVDELETWLRGVPPR